MKLTQTYFDHLKDLRQQLMNVEAVIGHPHARLLVRNARYALGLVLDLGGHPQNPYFRAHNMRSLHGKNIKARGQMKAEVIEDVPLDPVSRLELVRQMLNEIGRLIYSRLYLPVGEAQIGHLADFVSRAHQDVYLARCYVSAALASAAEEEEDDPQANDTSF